MQINIHLASFNDIIHNSPLIQELRHLTLNDNSGMNIEMDKFIRVGAERSINAYAAMAYTDTILGMEMVGWALISKEYTRFSFQRQEEFYPEEGVLFEIFVAPTHRRKGVGTELLKFARNFVGNETLCVCPWDTIGHSFYNKCVVPNTRKI